MGLALKGLRPKFRDHPLKMLWKLVLVFLYFKCFPVFYSKFCRMIKRIETNENSARNDWTAIIRPNADQAYETFSEALQIGRGRGAGREGLSLTFFHNRKISRESGKNEVKNMWWLFSHTLSRTRSSCPKTFPN